MWVQEKPFGPIGIANVEWWGRYFKYFFKRIEIPDLLSRQASGADRQQDSSVTVVHDASASLLMIASKAPSGEACTGEDLLRVVENSSRVTSSKDLFHSRTLCTFHTYGARIIHMHFLFVQIFYIYVYLRFVSIYI
jgi:hypothetical protein